MNQIVKWGIIGLGNIANEFAKAFNASDNAQLIALASKSKEKLVEFGKNFNIEKKNLFNDYNEIIEDNNIDIFYIALTNNLHFDLILKLLDKKRNILVEKPAFLTIKQAEIVFNNKNFENVFFSEGYMYMYHPQIIELINNIKSGQIGDLIEMETNFGSNLIYKKNVFGLEKTKFDTNKRIFNKDLGGGVILDLGCYTTSMSLMIASLKENIKVSNFKVEDIKTEYLTKDIDVDSSAKIVFDNKFYSTIKTSFIKEIGSKTIITGDQGQIIIEETWSPNKSILKILGKKNNVKEFRDIRNIYALEIDNISKDIIKSKTEASFPGISKKNILLNSKIVTDWINA
jgi:predicted dehydrogenase